LATNVHLMERQLWQCWHNIQVRKYIFQPAIVSKF